MFVKPIVLVCCLVLAVFCLVPLAYPAGPAFTGITAVADTAETVATNPAGMTRFKEPAFYFNPLVIYTENTTEVTVEGSAEKQTVSNQSWVALPGLYYVRPLSDRWAVGIGPNAASGLGATYDDEWAGRYLVEDWSLIFAGVAPAVAYRLSKHFSLGAALSINYSSFTLNKAVFNLDPAAGDGSFELEADGWGVGANGGLLYELTPYTRFGVAYRSEVSVTEEGTPDFSGLSAQRQELLERIGALNQDISVGTSMPQAVTAGAFHDFRNGWSFSIDVLWLDFSNWGLENVEIGETEIATQDTDYKDIWGGSLGVNYALAPDWTIQSGVFYLSSPLDKEDRTAFMRMGEMWGVGLGAKHDFSEKRSLAFDITYLQFSDGKFETQDVPVVGTIKGEYTTNYGIALGLSVTW